MRTLVLWVLLALALPLCAQIDNGNITGRVTDPTGAAIVGAQVTVTQTEMNFETIATSNEEGLYRTLNLRPGPYRVTVVSQGFKKHVREGIDLRGGQTLQINALLEIGAIADSVEVSAKAQLLDTETSSSGASLQGDYFYSLPNYQRHVQAVLLYTPGISFTSNQYVGNMSGMSVNGLGYGSIGVFEDGAIGTMGSRGGGGLTESVANSVEDMKVVTSALPAEYGHATGAVISVVKKSGTNQLHGLVSEQIRTRRMQHRRFFEQYRSSQAQPGWENAPGLLVQNPDANLNGPVYIPKLYDGRNKTFFMFGFELMIEKQTKQATNTVPTPEMLAGDFSFAGKGVNPNLIYDPTTTRQVNGQWFRDPFAGNAVPYSRWSKVAKTVIGMNPLRAPNVAGSWTPAGPSGNLMLGPMRITQWPDYTGRIDHQFSPTVKAYGSWTYNDSWQRQPPYTIANDFFDGTRNIGVTHRYTLSSGATWIASPTVVNDFRATYYGVFENTNSIAKDQDYATAIGMGGMGLPTTCMPSVLSGLGSENGTLQVGCGSKTTNENFTVKNDLTKTWGTHMFKMGYELLRYRLNGVSMGTPDGTFTYTGTNGISTNGSSIANTGQSLAAFMVGAVNNFSFTQRMQGDLTRSWQHSWYFQDDWKVTPNLTVNMGLRYNIEPPKKQKYGYVSLFDLTLPENGVYTNKAYLSFCPAGGCMGAYTHPTGAAPFNTDYGRFDPSFGLSWHFLPRFVFKGGFRLSHVDLRTDSTSLLYSDEMIERTYSAAQVPGNFSPLFMLDSGIPAWSYPALREDGSVPYTNSTPGRNVSIVSKDMKTPYVMTWNASLQTELSKDYMLELQYRGSAQSGGLGSTNINSRPWGIIINPATGAVTNLEDPNNAAYRISWLNGGTAGYYRPYPNLGNVNVVGNNYHMTNHTALVRIEKRYSKGLNFQAFYQFQKSIDGASGGNPYLDWGLNRGRTGSDQTHNFTGTMNYELPIGKGKRFLNRGGWVNTVFGQYNMAFAYTIASGTPLGMSISGNPTQNQYPGWMPTYGNVVLTRVPELRDNWQDLGVDRWTQDNQNGMINCAFVATWGNDCFTYMRSFTQGNNGKNLWNMQRIIAHSAAVFKEIPIKERLRMEVRLDLQNPFKWYNWGGPDTNLNMQNATTAKRYGTNTGGGESGTGTAGFGGTPLLNLTLAFKW